MGQKVNPNGFRLGIHRGWRSNWFVNKKDVPALMEEDYRIRRFLKKELSNAGVSKVDISRKADQIQLDIFTARPGVVVGKGGQGIETLSARLKGLINRTGVEVRINILEINRVDLESQLVAESIAQQLEKRVAFRRAMKQAMQRCMRAGAVGVKVMVAGRLGGAEIARTEWAKEGRIPLQTLRADIDFAIDEAHLPLGKIGVKTWIYRGEVFSADRGTGTIAPTTSEAPRAHGTTNTRPPRRAPARS